jgi:hypothetical protein
VGGRLVGSSCPPTHSTKEEIMPLYTALQTVAINNRNVVLYLVEGEEIELPEEEAAHIIPLGYIAAPEPPPEGRKGKVQKPETPEDKLEKRETRVIEDDDDPVMTTESFKGKK